MDSIKSIVVVAILLGVLFGIYQVINDDDSPVSPQTTNLMAEFDKDTEKGSDPVSGSESGESAKGAPGIDSGSAGLESGQATSVPPSTRKTVPPPPSNFSPDSDQFVFPERKQTSTAESTGTSPPPSQPDLRAETNSTGGFPDNGGSFSLSRDDQGDRTPPGSDPASRFTGVEPSSDFPVSKSGGFSPVPDAATQTSAESSINDPRQRFVTGSFVEFEKQVLGDMDQAEALIRENQFAEALKILTKFYDDPRLTSEENQNLASWLDPLAGKVIYSVEPHLVEPYYVRPNDTLKLLSVKFGVPPELIYNINRSAISDPQNLVAGTELKMVKGPFHAEISLSKKKLTLFVSGMYAGNFKIRIGNEPVPKTGKYRVLSKSRLGQDYTDPNYQRIAAAAPNNPYGKHYLSLGGDLAIHGSAQVSDSNDRRGCISLNAIDAEDVHNILTTESTVIIVE